MCLVFRLLCVWIHSDGQGTRGTKTVTAHTPVQALQVEIDAIKQRMRMFFPTSHIDVCEDVAHQCGYRDELVNTLRKQLAFAELAKADAEWLAHINGPYFLGYRKKTDELNNSMKSARTKLYEALRHSAMKGVD